MNKIDKEDTAVNRTQFKPARGAFHPLGFPGGSGACNAGDPSSTPGLGRSTGEGKGYPLQYSCLENSINRGA